MENNIDIVVCMDLTSKKIVESIKKINPLNFLSDLEEALKCASKVANDIRIKIIGFGDIDTINDNSFIQESRFFSIKKEKTLEPEYINAFVRHLKPLTRKEKVNALEGLALAINSDWGCEGDKQRHIIVLLTDTSAHKLEDATTSNSNYPSDMPTSLDELTDLWMTPSSGQNSGKTELKQPAKRLVVFGPQMYPWPELFEAWDQVVYNPSNVGEGLDSAVFVEIINSIVGSV